MGGGSHIEPLHSDYTVPRPIQSRTSYPEFPNSTASYNAATDCDAGAGPVASTSECPRRVKSTAALSRIAFRRRRFPPLSRPRHGQAEEAAPSPLSHSAFDPLPTRTRSARAPRRVPQWRQSQQRARAGRGPGPGIRVSGATAASGPQPPPFRGGAPRCSAAAARPESPLVRPGPARIPSRPARPGPDQLTAESRAVG